MEAGGGSRLTPIFPGSMFRWRIIRQMMVTAVLTSLDHADLKTGCYSERLSCVLFSVSISMAVFIDRRSLMWGPFRFLTLVPA